MPIALFAYSDFLIYQTGPMFRFLGAVRLALSPNSRQWNTSVSWNASAVLIGLYAIEFEIRGQLAAVLAKAREQLT